MSALDPLADVFRRVNLFCFVPRGDILDLMFDPIGMGSGRAQCSYIKSVDMMAISKAATSTLGSYIRSSQQYNCQVKCACVASPLDRQPSPLNASII